MLVRVVLVDNPNDLFLSCQGRGGKGAIYTWAAGNGGVDDDCGCDGWAGSPYTISVTAVGRDQGPAWYSEECSSVFVGAYSGDSPDLSIVSVLNQELLPDILIL